MPPEDTINFTSTIRPNSILYSWSRITTTMKVGGLGVRTADDHNKLILITQTCFYIMTSSTTKLFLVLLKWLKVLTNVFLGKRKKRLFMNKREPTSWIRKPLRSLIVYIHVGLLYNTSAYHTHLQLSPLCRKRACTCVMHQLPQQTSVREPQRRRLS